MSKAYLLPCSCGAKIPVEASRAGQSVRCQCGASHEVPTLRGLAALETAEPSALAQRRPWGLRQRFYLVGLVLLLAGLAGGAFVGQRLRHFNQHKVALDEAFDQSFDELTPDQLWEAWKFLRQGLPEHAEDSTFETAIRRELHVWLYAALAVAVVGLIVAGCGLLVPRGAVAGSTASSSAVSGSSAPGSGATKQRSRP